MFMDMNRQLIAFLVLVISCLHPRAAQEKLRVITTFLPGYCIAANVAGEAAEVENLLPGNVSLHDYQLSPGQIRKLNTADLVLLNGLGLETFLDRALKNAAPGTKEKTATLSAGLHVQLIHENTQAHQRAEEGHRHSHDPHIWLDPRLMAHGVTNAMRAMQKADPKNAEKYARNAAAYIQKLQALDADIARQLAPVKSAAFITYHNAFRYFVRRYELNLAGVVERVPELPPSTRERAQLQKTIREKNVKALFSEPGGNSPLARSIAQDTGIRLGELDPLETGELKADSYERGMRRNAEALVKGLQ